MVRTIKRLSNVKGFIRTRHSFCRPVAVGAGGTSPGQLDCRAVVIIAIIVWPAARLKAAALRTTAGRRVVLGLSEKGNGATAKSQTSQIAESLVVFGAVPFLDRGSERLVPRGVDTLHFPHFDGVALYLVGQYVTRFEVH